MRRYLRRPSPALVIACVALGIALSGTGYAVSQLPRNSVGTAQLKKNAVVSAKVKDRSLRATDFAAGQIPAGPQGDPGAIGATGAQGPQGPAGPRGSSVVARIRNAAPITTSGTGETNWPLTDNTWTQGASEINEFFGQVIISSQTCTSGGQVSLLIDGEVFVTIGFAAPGTASRMSRTFAYRMEPPSAVTHQLTARVSDNCPTAGQDTTVDNVRVDVVAIN